MSQGLVMQYFYHTIIVRSGISNFVRNRIHNIIHFSPLFVRTESLKVEIATLLSIARNDNLFLTSKCGNIGPMRASGTTIFINNKFVRGTNPTFKL